MPNLNPDTSDLPRKEIASFSAALGGQNVVFGIQASFMMFAFTDILLLAPAAVGTLFFIARLFDAANDPFMGIIADRTRSRWGKFRPWLLFVPVPLGVMTVLCFYNPQLGYGATLIYAYVIYFIWGILYTPSDIPLWSLAGVMTRNQDARGKLITIARIFSIVGAVVPLIFIPALAEWFSPDEPRQGYMGAVAVLMIISVPLMTLAFWGTTERVQSKRNPLSISDLFENLKINRPLQLVFLFIIIAGLGTTSTGAAIYFASYNLGDAKLVAPLSIALLAGIIVGMMFTLMMTRLWGKKNALIYVSLARFLILVIFFFVGYSSLPLVLLLSVLNGLCLGPILALVPAMMADSIDYAEHKTGKRFEGLSFSFMTFGNKAAAGIGAFAAGAMMALTGYIANQTQSAEALSGIFLIMTLVPALGVILSIIPILFYPDLDKNHASI